jgi:hypothetical protein
MTGRQENVLNYQDESVQDVEAIDIATIRG